MTAPAVVPRPAISEAELIEAERLLDAVGGAENQALRPLRSIDECAWCEMCSGCTSRLDHAITALEHDCGDNERAVATLRRLIALARGGGL